MQSPPQPRKLHVAASLAVILVCLLLMAMSLAWLMESENQDSLPNGVILFSLFAIGTVQQYLATFRRHRKAAEASTLILYVIAFVAVLAFASMLWDASRNRGDSSDAALQVVQICLLAANFILALGAVLAAWLNRQWARRLKGYEHPLPLTQFTLRELLGLTAAIAFFAACATWMHTGHPGWSFPPLAHYGEHLEPADAPVSVPAGATDISYCRLASGFVAFEFTIDQAGFRRWIEVGVVPEKSQPVGLVLQPIATPVGIARYNGLTSALPGPDLITVTSGLECVYSSENRYISAVYDSTTQRAYYIGDSF